MNISQSIYPQKLIPTKNETTATVKKVLISDMITHDKDKGL